jgi:hypothetical protein
MAYRISDLIAEPNLLATALFEIETAGGASRSVTLNQIIAAATIDIPALHILYKTRNLAQILDEVADIKVHGAIGDGDIHLLSERFSTLAQAQVVYPFVTSLTQDIDWAGIQSALNANTGRVRIPAGHYRPTQGNTRTTNVIYEGDGYDSFVDYQSANVNGALVTQGSLVRIGDLASNISKGARSANFLAAPDLLPEDVLIVWNPTPGSWLTDRNPYYAGEMWRVHSITGNNVLFYGDSSSGYVAANVQVWRLRGVKCVVENVRFGASKTYSIAPFKVLFGDTVKVSNYFASGIDLYTGLEIERSFDVTFQSVSSPNRSPAVGDEYGITISNCHNVVVAITNAAATRHAVALGGMDDVCCVPNRHVLMIGVHASNVDITNDIGAGDMHGNCDDVKYESCTFTNGAIMQGRDVSIRNSTIYGVTSVSGECVYGTEVYGGTYTLENNKFISYGDGGAFGIVHISPSNTQKEALDLILRGNTWELPNATGSTKAVFMRARGSTVPCSVLMNEVHVLKAPVALQCFLFADESVNATFLSNYLIVDNVFGPAGTYLLYPTAKNASVPTRQMKQRGRVGVATTAVQLIAAPTQPFRYPYSKTPVPTPISVYDAAGGTQELVQTQFPLGKVYQVTATGIRPAMRGQAGAFTDSSAAIVATLGWEVGIDEI